MPLDLGLLPTPLHPLPRASARLGVEVWTKRDDLTGFGLSGNKVRKLRFLLEEAVAQGARAVVTCGGIQSNHCRATAVAARQLGLDPVLLLRGSPPRSGAELESNLLLDAVLGAEVHWCDAAGYRERDARMAALAAELHAAGRPAFVIPEGGSNATGARGFVEAGHELAGQAEAAGLRFDAVICAVGSGGTLAGLAMAGLDAEVLGVAVCDDRVYFRGRVAQIAAEGASRGGPALPAAGWDVLEGFQGRGYALSAPDELRALAELARDEGLLLDPVYTGKAWMALRALAAAGRLGRRVLFWHTGGAFGLFGRGAELADALLPDLQARGLLVPPPPERSP
jgi:D-cysteine desulfhydrase